jgi:hypothetical protein
MSHSLCVMGVYDEVKMTVPMVVRYVHSDKTKKNVTMCNGMYLDGHECEDVVAYRNAFVARWKVYEKRFHTWDSDGVEHQPQNALLVEGGQFQLILVTHNESVFYQNDF